MAKAIEQGLPKRRIEEAAARVQARIDSGQQTILGVNHLPPTEAEDIPILQVDNSAVREAQLARLAQLKAQRDERAVQQALAALTRCAETGEGNLLALAVDAGAGHGDRRRDERRAREAVFGRHEATPAVVRGVYKGEGGVSAEQEATLEQRIAHFVRAGGPAARASSSRRWARTATTAARRSSPRPSPTWASTSTWARSSRPPRRPPRQAVENDVHIVGASSLAAGHLTLVPALRAELDKLGRDDILVVAGGVIPPQDHAALRAGGAAAIFGPGTVIADAALALLDELEAIIGELDFAEAETEQLGD